MSYLLSFLRVGDINCIPEVGGYTRGIARKRLRAPHVILTFSDKTSDN